MPRSILTAFVYLGCCLCPALSASGAKPVGEAMVYKTVDDRDLTLYVTKPGDWKATDTRPAIVFYHGGGWVGGAPGQFTEHAKYLASRGMVAIQVQYRLLDRDSDDPPTICVQDAKSAMRWVRGRASALGIDADRVASAGGSAGGHLAAFVGMVDGLDDPKDDTTVSAKSNAMVLFNPVFNNGPGEWGHQRVGSRYKEFSPAHNVSPDDPPAIVFLGSEDALVPVGTAETFKRKMGQAGVRCELKVFPGKPHGFFNHGRDGNEPYYKTVVAMDQFLASLGWLEGPPTLER
ncbi:MAG: alpha/beta hydrolase [Planctomycetota bacterium]